MEKSVQDPVVVSLTQLADSSISFEKLEEAFGPSSLGILIVKDLPPKFIKLRHQLLSFASYLANLPSDELERLSCPSSRYLTGWSHGKEALKTGAFDCLKGSYYVNCAFYQNPTLQSASATLYPDFPEYTLPNIWPRESLLPGFQQTFEELCTLVIDTAVLVARACDRYAAAHIDVYERGYLERIVKTSTTTKARLLHYFPPQDSNVSISTSNAPNVSKDSQNSRLSAVSDESHDSWCATHIDHGCLTGLTSALYIDESANPPLLANIIDASTSLPALPFLSSPPFPSSGLYIHSRTSNITKVAIPHDCLAFQTGEALQLITGGKFRAVPHFVRAGVGSNGSRVARNTLAVFTQPELGEVVNKEAGTTFGEFCQQVAGRFG